MVGRMVGLVAGSLTGMALGAVLVAGVARASNSTPGRGLGKEPLTLILVLRIPVGGFGRWWGFGP